MAYTHTQYGRWHYLFYAVALATITGAWLARSEPAAIVINLAVCAILALCGLAFGSLTICDEGDYLALRFGPLPLVYKRFSYADITGVEVGRTTILNGWGIHYTPGQGWTYNIWGFGCVKLKLGRKIVRVGTDDAEGLAKFLVEKIGF